jgi:carboxypeptidase Q
MPPRRAIVRPLVAAVLLIAWTPAEQVGEEPDLKAIDRIRRESAERSELMETARFLTDVYGPRLTGSPQLKTAADHVVQRMNAWGLDNVHFERWGPFGPGWTNDRFVALALAPQAYPLIAYPKAWTPGTAGDVIAEAVLAPVGSEADFKRYRGTLRGKFVLSTPPAEIDFARKRMQFFVDERVAAVLEPSRGAAGTVFVGDGRLRDDTAFAGGGLYPWPDEVAPQVVLAAEHYNRIARTLQNGIPVTLELNVASSYHPAEPDSFNIVAEIAGREPSQVVMLGAHLDSWHAGTGATDNAAGCAVMIEAMRILKTSGLGMRRTVRLALWTGSEQGLMGSRAYVAHHFIDPSSGQPRPEHAALSAYFDMDGGTGAIQGLYLHDNERVAPIFSSLIAPFRDDGVTTLSPRVGRESDHLPFDAAGLPAFQFVQDPSYFEITRHSNMDVYERLRPAELIRNAAIVASLIYHVANRRDPLPRKPFPAR